MLASGALVLRCGRRRLGLQEVVTFAWNPAISQRIRSVSMKVKPPTYRAPPKQKPRSRPPPHEPPPLGTRVRFNEYGELELIDTNGSHLKTYLPGEHESIYVFHPTDTQFWPLSDGRTLCYADSGSRSGNAPVVIAFHGTPNSRLNSSLHLRWAENQGVRVISFDRPGYGHSTPRKNMTKLDVAYDLEELLNGLGINRFYAYGTSAGGPHALACAHYFPRSRLRATGVMCGSSFEGYGSSVYNMYRPLKFKVDELLARKNWQWLWKWRLKSRLGDRYLSRSLGETYLECARTARHALQDYYHLPDERRDGLDDMVELVLRVEAYRQGGIGCLHDHHDDRWGFDLAEIDSNPIHMWHGTMDRNTPYEGAVWIKNRIRKGLARLYTLPGKDHGSVQQHRDAIRTLLEH